MAPIKFEEDLKSTIEKRTIEPSEKAWEKLSASLESHEQKNNRSIVFWFGVAASIVGVFWVVSAIFSSDVEVAPVIVDVPETEQIPASNLPVEVEESQDELIVTTTETIEQTSEKEPAKELVIAQEAQTPLIAEVEIVEIEEHDVQSIEIPQQEPDELFEVATQIVALNEQKSSVSDAEIDSLLLEAQLNIAKKKIEQSGMSVSAYALLFEVEEELDPSFKEKVFDVISKNYNSLKNAVATRND